MLRLFINQIVYTTDDIKYQMIWTCLQFIKYYSDQKKKYMCLRSADRP